MATVDISGLNKVDILREMWESTKPASFFSLGYGVPIPKWDESEARLAVSGYIDYFQGRCIKTDLSKDIVDTFGYDRDHEPGALQRIVDRLRK